MCWPRPKPPEIPPPLPPAPPAPLPPPPPEQLPEAQTKPVNPNVQQAQSRLGTKKGKKGSTKDLRIDKNAPSASGAQGSVNTGYQNNTGGLQ